ncbi:MAG: hypothetical protein ACOYLB_15375 [Phototrophicaceae bacterium]
MADKNTIELRLTVMVEAYHEGNYHESQRIWRELSSAKDNQEVHEIWRELSQSDEAFPRDFKQVGQTIRKAAKAKTDVLAQQMTQVLSPQVAFDVDQADEILESWASADADDDRLATNRTLVTNRKRRLEEERQYHSVHQVVKDYWDEADNLMRNDRNIGARALVDLYTRAYEAAREGASTYPNHARLQQLLEESSKKRANLGKEAEKMLSGANIEKIMETLEYLGSLADDDMPMVYNLAGQPLGRRSRAEARLEVEQQARQLAREKIISYIGEARDELAKQNPRSAQATLAEWNKFQFLEQQVANLLLPDIVGQLSQLRQAIQAGVDQLGQAEQTAEQASQVAQHDPLAGVETYKKALSIYAGASRSQAVIEARGQIQTTLDNTLDQEIRTLDTALKELDTEQVQTKANTLIEQYGELDKIGFILSGRLQRIETFRQEAITLRQAIDSFEGKLRLIEMASLDNPAKAKQDFDELERSTKPTILKANSNYERVKTLVGGRANANEELERLASSLQSNSLRAVNNALTAAKRNIESSPTHSDEFEILSINLEAHLLVLQATDLVPQDGYEKVIAKLEQTSRNAQLEVEVRRRVQNKLEQLREESEHSVSVKDVLEQAEILIPTEPQQAVKMLKPLVDFPSSADRTRQRNLLQRAEEAWRNSLRTFFRQIAINNSLDLDLLDEKLAEYEELDYTAADRERTRTQVYRSAETARRLEQTDDLAGAISTWENLQNRVKVEEINYIKVQITRLQHEVANRAIRDLLERVTQIDPQDTESFATWERDLIDQINQVQRLFDGEQKPQEKMELGRRLLPMYVERGLRIDKQMRQGVFDKAKTVGVAMQRALGQFKLNLTATDPLVLEVNNWVNLANSLPQIGGLLNDFERYVQIDSEFRQFRKATLDWSSIFIPYAPMLPTVEAWGRERFDAVRTSLYSKIEATPATERSGVNTLTDYAKLLTLDPNDPVGNRLWYMLRQIGEEQGRALQDIGQDIFGDAQSAHLAPLDLLHEQLDKLESRRVALNLIVELATNFSEMQHQLVGDARSLKDKAYQLLNQELEPMLRNLRLFEVATGEYAGFLQGYELTDDGKDGWKNYQTEFDAYWATFQQRIVGFTNSGGTLSNHPLVQKLRDDRGALNTRLSVLVNALKKIQEACAIEHFEEAMIALRNVDDDFFERQSLADSLRVQDVWRNQSIEGWEKIKTFIQERSNAFNRLAEWAGMFGAPIKMDDTVNMADDLLPILSVIDWNKVKEEVENVRAVGNFEEARLWVHGAQSGMPDYPLEGMPLSVAQERLSRKIPMALDQGLFTDSYNTARTKAGSQRGEQLLKWMETHRAKVVEGQLREATELLIKLNRGEDKVVEAERTFYDTLRSVQAELDKPFFARNTQVIRGSMETANLQLRTIESNTSKRNPKLETLKSNPTYVQGSKVG